MSQPLSVSIILYCSQTQRIVGVTRAEQPDMCGFPGGSVEDGERLYDAAIRELKEETGVQLDPVDLSEVFIDDCDGSLDHTYLHHVPIEVALQSPEEHRGIVASWYTIPEFMATTKYQAYNRAALQYFELL